MLPVSRYVAAHTHTHACLNLVVACALSNVHFLLQDVSFNPIDALTNTTKFPKIGEATTAAPAPSPAIPPVLQDALTKYLDKAKEAEAPVPSQPAQPQPQPPQPQPPPPQPPVVPVVVAPTPSPEGEMCPIPELKEYEVKEGCECTCPVLFGPLPASPFPAPVPAPMIMEQKVPEGLLKKLEVSILTVQALRSQSTQCYY